MNFLELVTTVRSIAGLHGVGPSSVATAQGLEGTVVQYVRQSWTDIQNHRPDWNFLKARGSFNLQASKETYSLLEVFGATPQNIKSYREKHFVITDPNGVKRILTPKHYENYWSDYLNNTSTGLPSVVSIDPSDLSLNFREIPDSPYAVSYSYIRSPQILENNTDIPLLPISYHMIIAYKALEKLAAYLGSGETFSEYNLEYTKMLGQLMRDQIEAKRMRGATWL